MPESRDRIDYQRNPAHTRRRPPQYNNHYRSRPDRPPLSHNDQALLNLRKDYKRSCSRFYASAHQYWLLRVLLLKDITPKGLRLRKPLMTLLPNLSSIAERHAQLLKSSERDLTRILSNHLRTVAIHQQCEALNTLQRMNHLTSKVSTNELTTHLRFLTATDANITRENDRRRRESTRKLNELLDRPGRRAAEKLIPTLDVFDRRLFGPPVQPIPAPVQRPPAQAPIPAPIHPLTPALPTIAAPAPSCPQPPPIHQPARQPPKPELVATQEQATTSTPGKKRSLSDKHGKQRLVEASIDLLPAAQPNRMPTRPRPPISPADLAEARSSLSASPKPKEKEAHGPAKTSREPQQTPAPAPQQPPPMDSFLPPDYHPLVKNPKELCMPSTHQLHNLVSNIDRINIHPVLDLSSRQLSVQEQEVLLLGLKFAPTPERAPDPLEFFDKYHDQCQRVYNKLIRVKSDMPLPRLIEEHLAAIKNKLAYTSDLAKQTTKSKSTPTGKIYLPNTSKPSAN